MTFKGLAENERRYLLEMLSEDHPDADRWMSRLREMRSRSEISAFSGIVKLLVNLVVSEKEAERLLGNIFKHRSVMARSLDRDPGLRVAAIDYLSNIEPRLTNPKIVEMALFEKTLQSALTDPLTGLSNRRNFHTSLEREVARSGRHGLVFSVLLLDLDGFKQVNDEYGHMLGDVALKKVARIFRHAMRDVDMASRLGGDEFAVILSETGRLGSFVVADRLRTRVAEGFLRRRTGGADIRLTLSGGIAMFPEDGRGASRLLERADESLYEAKRQGKNRIVLFHSEKRAAVRYPVRPSATVKLLAGGREEGIPARGLNLSRSGALVETDGILDDAAEVTVLFGDEEAGLENWEAPGKVVRVVCRDEHPEVKLLGIAFDRPLPDEHLVHNVLAGSVPRGGRS